MERHESTTAGSEQGNSGSPAIDPLAAEMKQRLTAERERLQRRLRAIQRDRRRERGPLDPDSEEQAVERENDEALDALDAHGRARLEAIDGALTRIDEGTYGACVRCGETISQQRLRARPIASTCITCANAADASAT